MKKTLVALAIAGLAATSPALAKPGHGNGHAKHGQMKHDKHGAKHDAVTLDQTGRSFNSDTRGKRGWVDGCPPGLAKRNNGCVPPGQAKRNLQIGQQLPSSFRLNQIPVQYQNSFTPRAGYVYSYNNGSIYEIDQATRRIVNILTPTL